MNINTILKTDFVNDLIGRVCGNDTTLVSRDNSYAVRRKHEGDRDIHRIIILPPKGYTANSLNQMNSHDEADYATIEIKGAVREGKNGFSKLKDCLFVASSNENGTVSDLGEPYLTYNIDGDTNPDLTKKLHSSGEPPFPVVKNNGYGFYHNLINVTDEWLVLKLYKRLRPQKSVDLTPHLQGLSKDQASTLNNLYKAIVKYGDGVFSETPQLVRDVISMSPQISLPALGEMLYVHDSGMHEACTAFAIILKIGKECPNDVRNFLTSAMKEKEIPSYYAQQLMGKIEKKRTQDITQSIPKVNQSRQDVSAAA